MQYSDDLRCKLVECFGAGASLIIASENRAASALYRSLDFQHTRSFAAYAWEGW